jgi:hypothetical protein
MSNTASPRILTDLRDLAESLRVLKMAHISGSTDPATLASLIEGDCVKVCRNDEMIWVEIAWLEGQAIVGTVKDVLNRNPDLAFGDLIQVEHRHIHKVFQPRH